MDDEDDLVTNGVFKANLPDPDYCNAVSANFVTELKKYEKVCQHCFKFTLIFALVSESCCGGLRKTHQSKRAVKWA